MVEPEEVQAYKAEHHLTNPDLARISGLDISFVRMWTHKKGPGFKPCPDDTWERIKQKAEGKQ